jgi:O-antigen ligase
MKLLRASQWCAIALAFAIPISTTLMDALFILTVVLVLASGQLGHKFAMLKANPVAVSSILYFAIFLLGLSYTTATMFEGGKVIIKYSKFLFLPVLLLIFTDVSCQRKAINAFLAAVALTLLLSDLKGMGLIHFNPQYGPGVFKDHIQTSFIMAFAGFLCVVRAYFNPKHRLYYVIFTLLIMLYLFTYNDGRSGQLMFILLLAFAFFKQFSWRVGVLGIVALCAIIGLAFKFSPVFHDKMLETYQEASQYLKAEHPNQKQWNTSIGLRMVFVHNSLELIKRHPFLGTGTGSFDKEYQQLTKNNLIQQPHNEYLWMGVQFGAMGIAGLVLLLFSLWRFSHRLSLENGLLAQGLVLLFTVGCFTNSWLLDTTESHLFIFFTALLYAALPLGKKVEQRVRFSQV